MENKTVKQKLRVTDRNSRTEQS